MKKFDLIDKSLPRILHGGDYNPEQWIETKEIWDEDMRLMNAAHCNEMTVGIFSWAELEPEEGKFDFSWLDEIIEKVYSAGGRVILATPSGARPRWLAEKYPEVLRVSYHGERNMYSGRHNHCTSSPIYREKVRIINEKLAERYGKHPAVAAWHLSNEYSGACYCPLCRENFRKWLQKRYDNDINKLNHEYWSRFWAHRYDSFSQVEPPMEFGDTTLLGLNIDWKRFSSDMIVDFARAEADTIRKYSDKEITTNCMCEFSGYDHYKMAEVLDRTSYDFYPDWYRGIENQMIRTEYLGALYRGMKGGKPFMIMESAPGINAGGMTYRKLKSSEEQLMEAIGCVANGADMIGYFQWRKGRGAYEKIHGAVVDHYGKEDSRVFKAVTKTGEYLEKISGVVGSGMAAEVAVAHDYETIWALEGTAQLTGFPGKNGYDYTSKMLFNAFREKNIQTDVIPYSEDFSRYKVLCLPVPYTADEAFAEKIKNYVKNGGILISTYLTAVTNENDLCHLGGVPGLGLSEVFGLRVDEVDTFEDIPESGKNSVNYKGKSYLTPGIAEVIKPCGAATLAEYEKSYYAGTPAILVNNYGRGKAYYIGFMPKGDLAAQLISDIAAENGIEPIQGIEAEHGVRITVRENENEKYYFVINYTASEKKITLSEAVKNLISEKEELGEMTLEPNGVRIFLKK